MKKIFLILIAAATLLSCGKDRIPIPESIMIEETDLTLVAEGETYRNRIYSTTEPIETEIPAEAKDWLSVTLKDKHLEIVVKRNASISPRTSSFVVKTKERKATVKISQAGLPTRKLLITSGVSSSEQPDGPIAWTFDGNYNTIWHSRYATNSTQNQNHTLTYNLTGAESLDLIMLYPRNESGRRNGRWGWYLVYVKGDGTNTPGDIPGDNNFSWGGALGSVDADGYKLVYKGDETPYAAQVHIASIVLPVPIANPVSVKIVINGEQNLVGPNLGGSTGGFGAMAEIELFGKVN